MNLLNRPFKRKTNYTTIGLHRQKCAICGSPAQAQWHVCSLDNATIPVCAEHDIEMNRRIVEAIDPDPEHVREIMDRYIADRYPDRIEPEE